VKQNIKGKVRKMKREVTEIDAEINATLDLLDAATAKLGAMPAEISVEGWEELREARRC
jgi:hypothetical protein